MTIQELDLVRKVHDAVSAQIMEFGYVKLNKLSTVFAENGIDRSIYQGKGPKKWLTENFPEFFIEGNNGREQIVLASDRTAAIAEVLQNTINAEGKILLALVPDLLAAHGFLYKELSGGLRLSEWITKQFLEFKIDEKGLWLTGDRTVSSTVPVSDQSADRLQEVQQMHAVSFMNWWSANIKKLRGYNPLLTNEELAKSTVASQFAHVLLGEPGRMIWVEKEQRVAFKSGLSNADGEDIYCVLSVNPKNDDGTKQIWALLDFACVSDDTPLGKWLKGIAGDKNALYQNVSELKTATTGISDAINQMALLLSDYCGILQEGKIPAVRIHDDICVFEDKIDEYLNLYESVMDEECRIDQSMQQISQQLEEKTAVFQQYKRAAELFCDMAENVHQIFVKCQINSPTPLQDAENVRHLCKDESAEISVSPLEELLLPYRALKNLIFAPDITQDIEELIKTVICTHFTGVTYGKALKIWAVVALQYNREFMEVVDEIAGILSTCSANNQPQFEDEPEDISAEELLEKVLACENDGILLSQHAARILPRDVVERSLVLADFGRLREYVCSHDTTSDYDVDLVEKIDEVEQSTELTYFAAGERLWHVLGNRKGLAEKYYILGLVFDTERCANALLEIYRAGDRKDKFAQFYVQFIDDSKVSLDNRCYYLSILCKENESAALEYADEHYYLFYMPESIALLCTLSDEILPPAQKKEMLSRSRQQAQHERMNAFEVALYNSDTTKIRVLVDDPSALAELGYSQEQITRIKNAAENATISGVNRDAYSIGCRFFQFQKNLHGLAERFMWSGLAQNSDIPASDLLLLLAQESRFRECCMLYEHYQANYSKYPACRRLYLISRLKLNPIATKSYIRANLQEVLEELNGTLLVKSTIEALAADSAEEISAFYSEVLALSKYLEDPLVKAVILLDRMLREYATESYMKELPVDKKYIGGASGIYKSDNYAHGTDAYNIASRIFTFCGTYTGAAEAFAKFSLPDAQAINLLCDIYTTLEDDSLLFDLMSEYPQLREKHNAVYLNGLFRRQMYAEFISEYKDGSDDYANELQLFVATLKVDPASDIALPDLDACSQTDALDGWFSSWGSMLISTLLSMGRVRDVERILYVFLDGWLGRLPADTVKNIVTGGGLISRDWLSTIQADALLAGQDLIALYIYRILGVGELAEQAAEFFNNQFAQIDNLPSDEEKLRALLRLSAVYGDNDNQINSRISILRVIQALSAEDVSQDEVAEKVAAIIGACSGSNDVLDQILLQLSRSQVSTDLGVCSSIDRITRDKVGKISALRYYHAQAMAHNGTNSTQYLLFVLQRYVNAFVDDYFPGDLCEDAYNLCLSFAVQTKNVTARFCLYFLESLMGHDYEAKFILRELADSPSDVIGEVMSSNIAAQLSKMWGNSLPSHLALFKEVLENNSIEEVVSFISYAGKVSGFAGESLSLAQSQLSVITENRMLSESESDDLIRLLYVNPEDARTRNSMPMLPLQDNPLCYAKILVLVAEQDNTTWKKCIEYCEKYDLEELLLYSLNRWVHSAPINQMNQCREFLEQQLTANPEYLSRLNRNSDMQQMLLQVSGALCDRLNPPTLEEEFHATMRSISLVAEKTGVPEALDYLLSRHGGALLGRNCNLAVVTVAYLLLDKRFEEARQWLTLLGGVLGNMNYRGIVDMLAGMSRDELMQWADKTESNITLQLMLPDGNRLSIEKIANITYNGIIQNNAPVIASVLLQMLKLFPNDYGLFNSLYDVSCTKFEGYLPILHTALRGLVRVTPAISAQSFYRRKQNQYVRMLAVLDAVVISSRRTTEIDGYDFNINTGDYYRQSGAANTTLRDGLDINDLREKTTNHLLSLDPRARERMCEAYLGIITGNWRDFLREAWQNRRNIHEEMELAVDKVEDVGFTRSAVSVLASLEAEERPGFVQWLKEYVPLNDPRNPRNKPLRVKQAEFVEKVINDGIWDKLCQNFDQDTLSELISIPFEDYSLMRQYFSKYANNAIMSKASYLYDLVFVMGGFVWYSWFLTEVLKEADKQFDIGNDYQANQLYRALYDLHRISNLVHTASGKYASKDSKWKRHSRAFELYETRYRLTSLFLGNQEMIDKVGSPDLKIWTCTNLILSLIYSPRADEVLRLASHFSPNQAQYAKALLYAMNQSNSDQEKLEKIDLLPNDIIRAAYCYVVKHPYNVDERIFNSHCLTNIGLASKMYQKYRGLADTLTKKFGMKYIRNGEPNHTLLLEGVIHANASRQKDPAQWIREEKTEYADEAESGFTMPAFAEGLEPLEKTVDLGVMIQEHSQTPRLAEYIGSKLEMSKRILQCALSDTEKVMVDAVLLYGCDEYDAARAAENTEAANGILLELAKAMKHGDAASYGFQQARALMPNGLYNTISTFKELSALLASYKKHRPQYVEMRKYVGDPLQSMCVGTIYDVLDDLDKLYSAPDHENSEVLRSGLSAGYTKLETVEANRWMELKNRVQKLINDEIYELDRRPNLQVEVHNVGVQRSRGYLHGKVHNIGQIAADNVVLQANYGNGTHSSQYGLDRLSPGAQAVFVIDYACDDTLTNLEYFLNISYTYEGGSDSSMARKGTLRIGKLPEPEYPVMTTDPNGILFSVNSDTGEVYNPNFVGRRQETAELRSLLNGSSFAEYKSAMLYGIRRSGKSSLLNYLYAYIKANYEDIICLHYDCQALKKQNCIQYLFVDYVMEQVEAAVPELSVSDEWEALKKRWGEQSFCADQHMEELTQFYPAVKKLIGNRGIYFIIDEIDRLFEKVENSAHNLEDLFGAISAMLSLPDCREAVHFVICGSNWLIRYNLRGDKKNQLLQRFGKQVIEIGKLREADAKELVTRPYKSCEELTITEEAVEWIWNYTGGLVWHTKLLADTAIEHAKDAGRYAVYASDVQASLASVLSGQWCKQFYEGCESGDEFKLVDAMQSLAARRNAYVHVNKLCELLQWEPVEVQRAFMLLKELKIVTADPVDPQRYRFEMDMYRRFFRSQPTAFERSKEENDMFKKYSAVQDRKTSAEVKTSQANASSESVTADPLSATMNQNDAQNQVRNAETESPQVIDASDDNWF